MSLKAVDGWLVKWLSGGYEELAARPRGKRAGEHQMLSETEQVRQAVLDHRPCDLGLHGRLWTRGQVGALIAKLYRLRLTEQGVGKYLRRWGLSVQRPDKRAVERNEGRECRGARRPTRSASVPTRSPAGPGARRAAPRSCVAAATGSR
ncbi:hypothetical protein GCM10010211_81650 [Streptomyces albospinus]|uniref:Winged helix-turn helix domain-containing protein n=1 Tax=Streptomyces albospinus TaxID=285515 RepID=A0ABQ2VND9_9ACTN|nr:hypothetical protein GCM10010211_81650 [Streptomyces albospinus]